MKCDRCQRRKATHAAHCHQGRAVLCPRCLATVSHAGDVYDYPTDIR